MVIYLFIDFMNENARDQNTDSQIHQPFKNKSSWKPNPPNRTLDTYKRAFKIDLLKSKLKPNHQHNLTKEQWKGLMELRKNPEIVIKKADKGSAVVIMNTTDYLREGHRQLSDPNFYTKIREDPTEKISDKICKVLTQMKNLKLITEKNFEFLNIKHPKAGDSTYYQKYIKNRYQGDQYVAQ